MFHSLSEAVLLVRGALVLLSVIVTKLWLQWSYVKILWLISKNSIMLESWLLLILLMYNWTHNQVDVQLNQMQVIFYKYSENIVVTGCSSFHNCFPQIIGLGGVLPSHREKKGQIKFRQNNAENLYFVFLWKKCGYLSKSCEKFVVFRKIMLFFTLKPHYFHN